MTAYILRRIGIAVLMVFVVTSLAFFLVALMPNDVTQTILGPDATADQRAALRADLGLDRPAVERYVEFWADFVRGDLGTSLVNSRPVLDQVAERLPITLTLAMGGTVLCVIIGIVFGTIAATRGGWVDGLIRGAAGTLLALPNFWLAVLLVLVFAVTLRLLPASGWTPFTDDPSDWAVHLTLPMIAIVLGSSASITRQARVAMLDVLRRDYISTLRATGLPEWRVVWIHALRNASIPVLTVVGLQFVSLFGGAVLIEQVFSLPGVGQLALTAVNVGDVPLILGIVVCSSVLILVLNLLIDVLYGVINPKARIV
ncbi:ABC transporter permease [Rathayibacter sp. VKM Ac-2760]|uniref:ABC transporter permease n=1 Tax=Rathayibacter sp. VKM Ac-2760 TaxID=2609253 RepID=UPI0013161E46|nr:ABC transporter permease [Rathayibacter sp. VKM Ac-2760]QHC58686.1 ABC transporter permease subunit [Rathayibacter sp. VKM Ac-2760]